MDKKANRSAINDVLLDLLVADLLCFGMYFIIIKLAAFEEGYFLLESGPLFIGGFLLSLGLFFHLYPSWRFCFVWCYCLFI